MPRPRRKRCIANKPVEHFYKPQSVKMRDLKQVVLSHDQLEALRLADVEKMEQVEAAKLMNISRSTFSRLLAEARTISATALTKGWALKIEGGDFEISKKSKTNDKGGN